MKKPWSISTTVRNPDRIRSFLQVVKDFEGVEFDQDQQIKFQIALIQKRLYKPTGLDNKLAKYYDSVSDMSIKHAQEIFKHMTNKSSVLKDDPGFRGRTSIAPLSKMGLVVSKKTIGKLYLTNFGKRFLEEDFDIGGIFLEYFFKWTLPNPDSDEFSEKDGFNIRPFIATLHIINGVNKEWEKLGNKPVGLSKEEFSMFVPTTIYYKEISKTVSEIILLRKKLSGKDKKEQDKIKKEYYHSKINLFFNDSTGKDLQVNFNNLKDYGDNAIRYFKLTRFFYIRGGGFYIDLEPRRHIEITSLMNDSNGEALKFKDLDEYLDFMDRDIIYPWESYSVGKYVKDVEDLIGDISRGKRKFLIVGGSPLYIKGIIDGIFNGPEADWNIRKEMEEVAEEKARQAFVKVKKPVIAEDTGVYFEGYNNFPGLFAKRVFLGIGFEGLLALIKNAKNKKAYFKTVVSYYDGKTMKSFSGILKGTLLEKLVNENADRLPYEKLFVPDGSKKALVDIPLEEKNKISHRAIATRKLGEWLKNK